jgi:Zn-dependent protease
MVEPPQPAARAPFRARFLPQPISVLWHGCLRFGGARKVELSVHASFMLTLLGVTFLLAQALFPRLFPGWTPSAYWLVASAVALTDGLAGLLHELGHAAVAMAHGRRVDRITLYGLVAAVRRSSHPGRPHEQILVAMAGPASHLLLAATLWAAWQHLPVDNEPLRVAAGFPAVSNLAVAVLNLVPVLPLDGGRAARALVTVVLRI